MINSIFYTLSVLLRWIYLFLSFSPSLLLSLALFLSLASSFALGNKLSDRIGVDLLGTGDFYVTGAPAPGILLCRGIRVNLRIKDHRWRIMARHFKLPYRHGSPRGDELALRNSLG